jgi:hypothetical protein
MNHRRNLTSKREDVCSVYTLSMVKGVQLFRCNDGNKPIIVGFQMGST